MAPSGKLRPPHTRVGNSIKKSIVIKAMIIEKGSLHIHLAFDVGFEIETKKLIELVGTRLAARANEMRPLSVSINRELQPIRIAFDPVEFQLQGEAVPFQVYVTFYELGAMSFEYVCPLHSDFEMLPQFAEQLENNDELVKSTRGLSKEIFEIIKPAVKGAELSIQPSVHYVFNIEKLSEPISVEALLGTYGTTIAKTLKASSEPIGNNEVRRTLQSVVTYSDQDLVFVTAKNAIVFDEDGLEAVDILELANMQALELRLIDSKLDRTLVNLYETNLHKKIWFQRFVARFIDSETLNLKVLNTIHLDSLIIADRVEQSFKLATDHYLARIHELCVNALFLRTLSAGIDRKLSTIRDISNDIQDREAAIRMETLEWIIIILILIGTLPMFFKS